MPIYKFNLRQSFHLILEFYDAITQKPLIIGVVLEIQESKAKVGKSFYHIIGRGIEDNLFFNIKDGDLDVDFAFSDEAIDKMEILSLNKKKVVTIENLTTFHYYNDDDSIIIFLGGYHNSMKRKLLQKLNSFNGKLSWFHMGDIDWGGFEIFINLRNMTGIDFVPLKMGISELIAYKDECAPVTEDDRRRLELLLQNPEAKIFYSTINFMLKNGYKLEQESLIFNF